MIDNVREKKPRTMQIAVYGLLLIIVILAMVGLRHFASGKYAHNGSIIKEDTIHAAIVYGPDSYRILSSEDGQDSIVGINYHLLKGLEKELGVKVVMHPVIDRDQAISKVASGEYDIFASLPADSYLKQDFLTTRDVYLDRMVLLQLRGENGTLPARSALDLENDTIHVEKESAAKRRLENLQKEIGGHITIIEEPELSEEYLAIKVATSAWKFSVVNEKTAKKLKEQYPDLDYSTPVSFTQFQVWIMPQGKDSLLNLVNDYLNQRLKTKD
ncbi:MAG: transporter substrate-binding domain-containing protein [Muribaculaceae bacterium]|nr:transporter substrate-binding domain-containing protein [Muribaculaceae bacterium]